MSEKTQNIIILAIGILAILVGGIAYLSEKKTALENTEAATAVLVSYEESEEYDSAGGFYDTVYAPVVRFTVNGTEVEETYCQYYSTKQFEIGESIPIHYSPDRPDNYTIDGDNRGSVTAAWEIPVGIALAVFAIYRMVKQKAKAE